MKIVAKKGKYNVTTNAAKAVGDFMAVTKPSKFGYTLTVRLPQDEAEEILEVAKTIRKTAQAEAKVKHKKAIHLAPINALQPMGKEVEKGEDEDGNPIIEFKADKSGDYILKLTGEKYTDKETKKDVFKSILCVDEQLKPIPESVPASVGSLVKAMFVMKGYDMPNTQVPGQVLAGVSFKLKGCQILELVEYGGVTIEETGFEVEKDYIEEAETTVDEDTTGDHEADF